MIQRLIFITILIFSGSFFSGNTFIDKAIFNSSDTLNVIKPDRSLSDRKSAYYFNSNTLSL